MKLEMKLKKLREENNITQKEMAEACRLSKNYLSAMERGLHKCSARTLITYARKMNMLLDDVISDTE